MGNSSSPRAAAVALLMVGTLLAGPAVGAAASPDTVIPGVPAGGPPVLYARPPDAPELSNHDPRFRAPYELVSGTERYVDGEYLYTDFLYDDEDTTYPADFERFGNNAADLVEYRMSTRGGDLAVRLSLTTLLAPDSTIAVVAFDSDRDPATGGATLQRDPGVSFPGTDHVLTTWGTGAEWSTWTGTAWQTVPLPARADLEANQVTVTVPKSVADPQGRWSATLAVGLYDPASGGWLAVESTHGSDIVNLGFRFDEMEVDPKVSEAIALYDASPSRHQNAALAAGAPTTFARELDFDLLHARGEWDNVPTHGLLYRMFASRLETVDTVVEGTVPRTYDRTPMSEGKNTESQFAQFLSPLQPYALYVPSGYTPSVPAPLTFGLHGDGGNYWWMSEFGYPMQQLGEDRGSIVLSPSARGHTGFYVDEMEYDVFEAWNDVARHYTLDPLRTAMTGWSMGGYGTYRLGLLYPHLFSRAVAGIPAGMKGLWMPGVTDDHTVANRWLENARNLPFFHLGDMASELTFWPGQYQNVAGPAAGEFQSLDSLGYRYRFWSFAADHASVGVNFPEITEYLADHTIEPEPFHVTYSRMPSNEAPQIGLVHDRAYWVSDIELRDATNPSSPPVADVSGFGPPRTLAEGRVDAVSLGFGRSDPPSAMSRGAGVTQEHPYVVGGPGVPYIEQERVWGEPGTVPVENRIVLTTTNVRSLTIDPVAARVDCNVDLDITSDGPLEVTLLGCEQADEPIDPAGGLGRVDHGLYRAATGTNDVLVYVPEGWKPADQLPLYVMVHGCGTTADQQMHANLLNALADRERFIVAYPDNNGQCWRAVSEDVYAEPATGTRNISRGQGGDADIIAGITRQVIDGYNVDTERVYLAGMSSGAFETSAVAAAYPELYAAIGLSAGGGYGMSVACLGYPEALVPLYAQATVEQMGERAHVMPIFTIGGDADPLGEQSYAGVSGCSHLAYLEWLFTNNILQPGAGPVPGADVLLPPEAATGDTFQHDPASTQTGQVADGHAWSRQVARDRVGCQIGERWIVHGMGHYWSGGTTDPKYWGPQGEGPTAAPGFNDPKGPSASEASWNFFKQFTLSGGNTACAT